VIPFLLYKQQTNKMNNKQTKTAVTKVINSKVGDTNEKTLQKDSINDFVKNGKDFYGNKIPKKVIELSLKLENWVSTQCDLKLIDSFSDFPPSYVLLRKRKKPTNEYSLYNRNTDTYTPTTKCEYYSIMEIFPHYFNGKEYFTIRDGRILSPYNYTIFSKLNTKFSFEQLVELIERNDLGIDMWEYMKLKGLKSLDSETPLNIKEILSIEL
jgi:hypothetical protein